MHFGMGQAMQALKFQGAERLVAMLDEAVQQDDVEDVTAAVKLGLSELICERALSLPDCVHEDFGDHYARRLLYKSDRHGYSVVAMTWGPEQGTALHDHAGMWCVEAVCDGRIRVTQYELVERRGVQYRFERRDTIEAGVGSAGCLIPPHEYHTIANCCDESCAVSLHIYSGDMTECHVFESRDGEWYTRATRGLSYDAI